MKILVACEESQNVTKEPYKVGFFLLILQSLRLTRSRLYLQHYHFQILRI